MRPLLLMAPILLFSGCGTPTADDVAERWPEEVDKLAPVTDEQQEQYEELLLDSFDGAESIDFYTLDETSYLGPLSVVIVTGEDELTGDEINQLRCDLAWRTGAGSLATEDEYDGELGLHGSGGTFSVNADGVGVLVVSSMDSDDARTVAEELGGEDEDDVEPCDDSERPRIAG